MIETLKDKHCPRRRSVPLSLSLLASAIPTDRAMGVRNAPLQGDQLFIGREELVSLFTTKAPGHQESASTPGSRLAAGAGLRADG
jgi:hypothetical protein